MTGGITGSGLGTGTSFTTGIINKSGQTLTLTESTANPSWANAPPPQSIPDGTTGGPFGNNGTASDGPTGYVKYVAQNMPDSPWVSVGWSVGWNINNSVSYTSDPSLPLVITQNGSSGGLNPDPSYTVTVRA